MAIVPARGTRETGGFCLVFSVEDSQDPGHFNDTRLTCECAARGKASRRAMSSCCGMAWPHRAYLRYFSVRFRWPLRLMSDPLDVDAGQLQRSVNHLRLLSKIKRPLFTIAPYGHAVVQRDEIARLVQRVDNLDAWRPERQGGRLAARGAKLRIIVSTILS